MSSDTAKSYPAERLRAFVDAVVAIAMTLLILPLMESASEVSKFQREHPDFNTVQFFAEHSGQVGALIMSFSLIALAWSMHHRLYSAVQHITTSLVWLNILWMFMVICLPVTTALVGALRTDKGLLIVYVGNLVLLYMSSLAGRLYLLRHPYLIDASNTTVRNGVVADVVAVVLFLVALGLALVMPVLGFSTLLLMLFTPLVAKLFSRDETPQA